MGKRGLGQFVRTALVALSLCAVMSFAALAAEDSNYIGLEAAKKIALEHAGVPAAKVNFTQAKLEKDDGVAEYEIRFAHDNARYKYEIEAKSGKILSHSQSNKELKQRDGKKRPDGDRKEKPRPDGQKKEFAGKERDRKNPPVRDGKHQPISLDQAKNIALKHAGITASEATFTKAKLDKSDKRPEYEIEFVAKGKKYEYDIDPMNGKIKNYEVKNAD